MLLVGLAGCGPNYSPDTYSSAAVQQANKVEQGVIVGVREVAVTVAGTVGTVTGAAAGGIVGSQVGSGAMSALGALGGTVLGGLAGSAAEKVGGEPKAFEYIVRKTGGELVSVTQKDEKALGVGLKVLVIAGAQARIVPDYTVQEIATAPPARPAEVTATPLPAPEGAPPAPGGTPAAAAPTPPSGPSEETAAPPTTPGSSPPSTQASPTQASPTQVSPTQASPTSVSPPSPPSGGTAPQSEQPQGGPSRPAANGEQAQDT